MQKLEIEITEDQTFVGELAKCKKSGLSHVKTYFKKSKLDDSETCIPITVVCRYPDGSTASVTVKCKENNTEADCTVKPPTIKCVGKSC